MNGIQLRSGGWFCPDRIHELVPKISDIAHSLSNLCRFGGHVPRFYSVAQHSVYVLRKVQENTPDVTLGGSLIRAWALLHDAVEAYLIDVPKPLKAFLPDYCRIESRVETHLMRCFGLPPSMPRIVKYWDNYACAIERKFLMGHPWEAGDSHFEFDIPSDDLLPPCSPKQARVDFLQAFEEIKHCLPTPGIRYEL